MAKLRVIGCSRDSVWSHRAWAEALGIAFTLVSDWDGEAARAFGVLTDRNGMEVSRRAVFLVDGGTVRGAWTLDVPSSEAVDELLAAARSS